MNNRGYGAFGEVMAEKYLKKQGYKILATNCKFLGAELDIVAKLPIKAQKKKLKQEYKEGKIKTAYLLKARLSSLEEILVFVEVKYSSTRVYGEPYERVDRNKQRQIVKASEMFVYKNNISMPVRYDVISIVGKEINHIEDAFSPIN